MRCLPVVIHERRGIWARQLRARLACWPIRWSQTRSSADLATALVRSARPIVVIDLGDRPRSGLEDLDLAIRTAPDALVLVLDPGAHDSVAISARMLGATHVFSGIVTPPTVAELLARWLALA